LNISYISLCSIPSKTAQSIGTMKLCEAFTANGHKVSLFVKNKFWEKKVVHDCMIWEYYGIRNQFDIIKLPALPRFNSLFYNTVIYNAKKNNAHVFTRSVCVACKSIMSGCPAILELHSSLNENETILLKKESTTFYLIISFFIFLHFLLFGFGLFRVKSVFFKGS